MYLLKYLLYLPFNQVLVLKLKLAIGYTKSSPLFYKKIQNDYILRMNLAQTFLM